MNNAENSIKINYGKTKKTNKKTKEFFHQSEDILMIPIKTNIHQF